MARSSIKTIDHTEIKAVKFRITVAPPLFYVCISSVNDIEVIYFILYVYLFFSLSLNTSLANLLTHFEHFFIVLCFLSKWGSTSSYQCHLFIDRVHTHIHTSKASAVRQKPRLTAHNILVITYTQTKLKKKRTNERIILYVR